MVRKTDTVDEKKRMDRRIKRKQTMFQVATIAGFAAIAYLLRRTGADWKTSLTVACLVIWVVWSFIFVHTVRALLTTGRPK